MQSQIVRRLRLISRAWLKTAVIAAALILPAATQAQAPSLRTVAGFFDVGGYFFTSGSAARALGTPKFYSEGGFFTHSSALGPLRLSGGVQFIGASDHFLPFSGGNVFSLIGASARLSTPKVQNRLRFVVTGGLYAERARSVSQRFDTTIFAPSAEFGAEFPFARYFTITAGYRISTTVHGVDTNGFSVGLRFF